MARRSRHWPGGVARLRSKSRGDGAHDVLSKDAMQCHNSPGVPVMATDCAPHLRLLHKGLFGTYYTRLDGRSVSGTKIYDACRGWENSLMCGGAAARHVR